MAVYSGVISSLIEAEGNIYRDNLDDYGGGSKFGISSRSYPDVNIRELTLDAANVIYERDFWVKYQLGEINDQTIANQTFLLLINMNPKSAVTIVQNAINYFEKKVIVDGSLGAVTFEAINQSNTVWLSDRIRIVSISFYLKRTDDDNSQIPNLRSWIRRALI